MSFWLKLLRSLSISASMRLLDTKAISMPEKNADRAIVAKMLIIRGMSVSKIC